MSRFNFKYTPLASFELIHDMGFEANAFVQINPSEATAALIKSAKLFVMNAPAGLVVSYKKRELFNAVTSAENLVVNGVNVANDKVTGYESIGVNGTFGNWLPNPADMTLTFYLYANNQYKKGTIWDGLALNEFIKYDASELNGVKIADNNISLKHKPDAIIELTLTDANVSNETEVKTEFKTKII